MSHRVFLLTSGIVFAWMLYSGAALACDPVENGCMGCNDDTLMVCINEIVTEICSNGRPGEYCDRRSATDDVEELVLKNMGRHMSRVRALIRGGTRYSHARPIRH